MTENEISRQVFDRALELLNGVMKWQKAVKFGVPCDPNATTFTLGCAMEKALIEVRGSYENRGREMSALRWQIYKQYFWRATLHPVTYFNRHRKTSYFEVIDVLKQTRKKFED